MEGQLNFILLLIGGIFIILIILAFLFFYLKIFISRIKKEEHKKNELKLEYQKDLLKVSIEIQEKERQRIAMNLHDDIISQLNRVKLINNDPLINEMIKKSIFSARTISHDLSPPLLEQTSIGELILDFIQPYYRKYTVYPNFTLMTKKMLSSTEKLHILRIIQEIFTNIDKHSKAKSIEILVRKSENYFTTIVKDNGRGFNIKNEKGSGLKNIELRMQIIGGKYRVISNKSAGTKYLLTFKNYGEKN